VLRRGPPVDSNPGTAETSNPHKRCIDHLCHSVEEQWLSRPVIADGYRRKYRALLEISPSEAAVLNQLAKLQMHRRRRRPTGRRPTTKHNKHHSRPVDS
jgi:hypothetical protein